MDTLRNQDGSRPAAVVLMLRILAALALMLVPASSHEHWIRNGKYMDATTNTHCCDENDCKALSAADVAGVLIAAGGGLIVGGISFQKGQLHKSEDGKWYRCANRCVFTPVEG